MPDGIRNTALPRHHLTLWRPLLVANRSRSKITHTNGAASQSGDPQARLASVESVLAAAQIRLRQVIQASGGYLVPMIVRDGGESRHGECNRSDGHHILTRHSLPWHR